MELVPDRKVSTLIPIIEKVVKPGSTIHRQLHQHPNYTYQAVNHSKNFVDPDTGVHTQATESYWAKAKFKKMKGVSSEQLTLYLERMWRDRFGINTTPAYGNIMLHISQQYVVN